MVHILGSWWRSQVSLNRLRQNFNRILFERHIYHWMLNVLTELWNERAASPFTKLVCCTLVGALRILLRLFFECVAPRRYINSSIKGVCVQFRLLISLGIFSLHPVEQLRKESRAILEFFYVTFCVRHVHVIIYVHVEREKKNTKFSSETIDMFAENAYIFFGAARPRHYAYYSNICMEQKRDKKRNAISSEETFHVSFL